jgi:ABC-type glycerol-3-phosphate transport system substrate-binding protein
MRKTILALALVATLAACGNSSTNSTNIDSATTVPQNSTVVKDSSTVDTTATLSGNNDGKQLK